MLKTVHEVSQQTGVSVRTLHHYDAIGLLKPSKVTEAGYRLSDEAALQRLQSILLFRQLQFSLKEIRQMLDCPDFDPDEALRQQIRLLELQRKHIEELIIFARELQQKGGKPEHFTAFRTQEMEDYANEVKQRWGYTEAYAESQRRAQEKTPELQRQEGEKLMEIFAEFGRLRGLSPEEQAPQQLVKRLQEYISATYYPCTDEILSGLGKVYTGDSRMKQNIDRAGGEGTADFAAAAIAVYVKK